MKRLVIQTLTILIIATAASFGTYLFHPDRPPLYLEEEALSEGEVSLEDALTWDPSPLWIDARAESKFDRDHIPEAISLNEQNWDNQLMTNFERFTEDRAIVVYCDQHSCKTSKIIADKLRDELGLKEVYTLRGGWVSWESSQD